jgi:valyl-tRNA synthetase
MAKVLPSRSTAQTYDATIAVFEDVMKLLHPFMPFLTEELWSHLLNERKGP